MAFKKHRRPHIGCAFLEGFSHFPVLVYGVLEVPSVAHELLMKVKLMVITSTALEAAA